MLLRTMPALKSRRRIVMNKTEKGWMAAVADLGCIVCKNEGYGFVPCCVHHLLSGGRRIGHLKTIGLCPSHHASGVKTAEFCSRHPWAREFEKRYGTEENLLKQTQGLINDTDPA